MVLLYQSLSRHFVDAGKGGWKAVLNRGVGHNLLSNMHHVVADSKHMVRLVDIATNPG